MDRVFIVQIDLPVPFEKIVGAVPWSRFDVWQVFCERNKLLQTVLDAMALLHRSYADVLFPRVDAENINTGVYAGSPGPTGTTKQGSDLYHRTSVRNQRRNEFDRAQLICRYLPRDVEPVRHELPLILPVRAY